MWPFKPNIAKMESCSDVNGVIKASAHGDKSTALAALAALGRLGDTAAVGALRTALKTDDDDKRKTAAESLVAIGRSVADVVAAALKDDNYKVRESIAGALEQTISKGKWDELAKRRVGDLAAAGEWRRLSTLALRTTDQNMRAFIQDQMRNCADQGAISALVAEALSPKGKKGSAIELLAVCDKATTGNIIAKSIFDSTESLQARAQPATELLIRIVGPEQSAGLIRTANIDHIVGTIADLYGKMALSATLALSYKSWDWKGAKGLERQGNQMGQGFQDQSLGEWKKIVAVAGPIIRSDEVWEHDAAIEGVVQGLRKAKENMILKQDDYVDLLLTISVRDIPELNMTKEQLRKKANL